MLRAWGTFMTFLEAAIRILSEADQPMTAGELTELALERGLIDTGGKTPAGTMRRELGKATKRVGWPRPVRVDRGLWVLEEGPPPASAETERTGYWLFVTSEKYYDTEQLFKKHTETWGEVIRGTVAQKRIREEVRRGDRVLVYRARPHKDIFAELEVVSQPYVQDGNPVVDVKSVRRFEPPVPLGVIRRSDELQDLEFLSNTRLSISHVTEDEYQAIKSLIGEVPPSKREDYSHERAQWELIRLGRALACDVWVGIDCRNNSYEDNDFSDFCLHELPDVGFNEDTVALIQHIDVLWLQGNAIVAAFEIEHSTSIYSGLLRMSDLVALQPNINIDLFIVAAPRRRDKVVREVKRPTFSRLPRPLTALCQYIPYDELTGLLERAEGLGGHLQVTAIQTAAEDLT
jgi:predicted RNA-binding protein with PUA-like domain